MNDFANSLFWTEVSGEHELQQRTSALAHGKVAVSSYWPFLASAESERDFENRLEIVSARLETLVDPDVLPDVLSGLRDDYRLVTGAKNPFAKDDDDDDKSEGEKKNDDQADDANDKAEDETGTDNDDDDSDDKSKDDGDDDDSNDDDQDDKDKSGQPSWLKDKNKDQSTTGGNTKESKTAGSPWDIGKPCTSCGAEPKVTKKRDGSVSQTTTHDADCKMMARTFGKSAGLNGPWHHTDGESAYKQGYHHGSVGVLPVYTGNEDYLMGHRDGKAENPEVWKNEKTAGTYTPDPSDKDRYYPPYANLETLPLNNGDLQGPDGYIQDLAEGEQRTPEAYARQTTPGTWSLGDGMPERPMPQGVERGYHPVASLAFDADGFVIEAGEGEGKKCKNCSGTGEVGDHDCPSCGGSGWTKKAQASKIANKYIKQQGDQWVITQKGTGKVLSHHDSEEKANASFRAMMESKHGSLVFDQDGFLVTSLVDPPVGAPLKANPYYFDQGSAGLSGMSFPTSPSQDPEDDRVNEYGDVAPQMSSGSTEGQNDGNGYSRSQPGRQASRNFNEAPEGMIWVKWDKTSATDGKFVKHCPGCDVPLRLHTTLHGDELHHVTHDGVRCHGGDAKTAQHLPSGSNIAGFDHSLSFAEGLIYNQGYGIHNAAEFFPSFLAAGDYVSRPGADDPTGRGDDWSARTWDAGANTRPLQSAEDRGVNTPVRSSDPIRTRNIGGGNPQLDRSRTDHMEMSGNGDEDDD